MTIRALLAFALAIGATPAAAQVAPAPAPFVSLTDQFAAFADETAALPDADRVARFKQRFATLFPGFYEARGRDPAKYDTSIANALRAFPENREKFTAAARAFTSSFETATARFRRFFPDFAITMPVWLVHSLGEMDGGTRTIAGRNAAVFGADVIARIHDESTIPPFLDHELFHIYHAGFFPDCDALWCSLWQEGLAVYVASRMNEGASDRQLMLITPRPIRPEVEPHLEGAICYTRAKFDSTDQQDYGEFFFGNGSGKVFPPRFGYFVGYVVARKLGETHSLEQLAKMPAERVRPLILDAMASIAPCGGTG